MAKVKAKNVTTLVVILLFSSILVGDKLWHLTGSRIIGLLSGGLLILIAGVIGYHQTTK